MTKAEIIAELRRSAREDVDPWQAVADPAYYAAANLMTLKDSPARWKRDQAANTRIYFLFAACALEDECH